ncbi:unnamed protein product [Penicillium camemberti]|uniref:Str. FM013 n=1 Tax=Penicillium camemberti (strain FM 013) TaxID=1429867 RepID=A0A0G4PI67_PENC3|nr:unnamed protein product [Penicillium camemberti]
MLDYGPMKINTHFIQSRSIFLSSHPTVIYRALGTASLHLPPSSFGLSSVNDHKHTPFETMAK